MKVVILHGYNRNNVGDGLLVDEAVDVARDVGATDIFIVALDPGSFENDGFPVANPLTGRSDGPGLLQIAWGLVTQSPHRAVSRKIAEADLVLGVGGGYLRAGRPREYLAALAAHRPQLPKDASIPHFYLPQSIGPQPPRLLPGFAGRLKNARSVMVRDDRSMAELSTRLSNVQRFPDLAVLAVARAGIGGDSSRVASNDERVGLIGRALPGNARGHYEELFGRLHEELKAELLIQSDVTGSNDDRAFYRRVAPDRAPQFFSDALSGDRYSLPVVVSVRLHGSIRALLAGIPSIHLSYERKGWGAYEDLGIGEYVHNARSFCVSEVVDQVAAVRANPAKFWERISERVPRLAAERERMIELIRCSIGRRT